jgi:hypothetical protein
MTKFLDGPAKGKTLMLKRAPVFLRVVEFGGEIDALDQLEDVPQLNEKLTAYTLVARPGVAFVDCTKCRGAYPIATYHLVKDQPSDAVMRINGNWSNWCEENGKIHPLILESEINRSA